MIIPLRSITARVIRRERTQDCCFTSTWDKLLMPESFAQSWSREVIQRMFDVPLCRRRDDPKNSPCTVQTASSSPPNNILWLFVHRSCLWLSDAGFHTLVLRVSVRKRKKQTHENKFKWRIGPWIKRRNQTAFREKQLSSRKESVIDRNMEARSPPSLADVLL